MVLWLRNKFGSRAWSPPQPGFIKINTDGAMKLSTGMASAGGLIRDHQGHWLVSFTSNIGKTNSFMAELWGFREGLIIARNRGYEKIMVETDSKAMVQALKKKSGSSPNPNTLISDCKLLMDQFQVIKIVHVFREGNQCADFLANMGQESPWGTIMLVRPPDGIRDLLDRDSQRVATSRRH